MRKNGWMLLLVLLCVAFLVSCGKGGQEQTDKGELVRTETEGEFLPSPSLRDRSSGYITNAHQ